MSGRRLDRHAFGSRLDPTSLHEPMQPSTKQKDYVGQASRRYESRITTPGVAGVTGVSLGRIAAGDISFQMIDSCILFGNQPFQ